MVPLDKSVPKFKKAFEFWSGSDHYKTQDVEPIDLYHSGGFLFEVVKGNLIKYGFRLSRHQEKGDMKRDLLKVAHYAALLYETLEE